MASIAGDLSIGNLAPTALRDVIATSLGDLKGRNILVLDVAEHTDVTDHMVLASGTSERHIRSLVDNVEAAARDCGARVLGVEGRETAEWVLVDLGDVVVHVMQPQTRAFYDLERLWSDVAEPSAEKPA